MMLGRVLTAAALFAVACSQPQAPAPASTAFPTGEVVDLSHAYDGTTIFWPTSDRFRLEKTFDGVTPEGFYYAANNFFTAEHGGTHLDAPVHFARGAQAVHQIPIERFLGPAAVIDVVAQADGNRDYQVTVEDLQRAEREQAPIPSDAILLIRTGYSRRWPDAERYLGTAARGAAAVRDLHFPGLHPDAARWLIANRPVKAVGIDTASIDYGQSALFESHRALFERNIPAFENLTALDRLPLRGAFVVALPMKIGGGSGAPLRAIAILPSASSTSSTSSTSSSAPMRWGMVIHGGAGNFTLESIKDRQAAMRTAMTAALTAGHRILAAGGASLDAVQAAVVILEDAPQFNAGKGAVFTHEGTNELDASIMDGRTMMAGAVAGVKRIKNPIRLARLVMEKSPHVMMAGDGAEAFAKEQGGIEFVPESYFRTELRWQQLQRALEAEKANQGARTPHSDERKGTYFGTVGAVALDQTGNLAAATSTGGITNKRFGRVGDSPIVGAGTYASNRSCAVSGTGTGEYFIRFTVARDICARVEYRGIPAQQAADEVVQEVLKGAGGQGGVIGLDRLGGVVMSFNTTGMARGYMGQDGKPIVMFTTADSTPVK